MAVAGKRTRKNTSTGRGIRWCVRAVLLHLGGMLVLVVVVGVLSWQWLMSYTHHGEEIGVPDVRKLPAEAAIYRLRETGLDAEVQDSLYVPTMSPGLVYEQSIAPGNTVKRDRKIYLIVCATSAPLLTLPDVADNSSVREATMKLRSMGFNVGEPEYCYGERDWVYMVKCNGRNVYVGSKLDRDDEITLVVGNGMYEDNTVSDVDGEELMGATQDSAHGGNSYE